MTMPSGDTEAAKPDTNRKAVGGTWNYHPPLPIRDSPFASWPLKPFVLLKTVLGGWLPISQKLIVVGVAALTWFYLTPSQETMKTFAPGWVTYVFARNLVMFSALAGGLHLYLVTFHRQGDNFRFDRRPFQKGQRFSFKDQVKDNMFWSLVSGIPIWSAYEVGGLWAYSNGYLPYLAWSDNPVWFVILFVVIAILGNVHFYWIHRLIHWQPLYKMVHSLHHRNIVCGPWSGFSMHPVEHVLYLSNVLLHLILVTHPIHFIFSLQVKTLLAPTSHAGFEKLATGEKSDNGLNVGDFFHQLHHRYFECNYGEPELPFDNWFGTFHDGTSEATQKIRAQIREKGITRT